MSVSDQRGNAHKEQLNWTKDDLHAVDTVSTCTAMKRALGDVIAVFVRRYRGSSRSVIKSAKFVLCSL